MEALTPEEIDERIRISDEMAAENIARRLLLADFLAARCSLIAESSGSMQSDWRAAIADAQMRADQCGIEWQYDMVPEYVRELIAMEDEL